MNDLLDFNSKVFNYDLKDDNMPPFSKSGYAVDQNISAIKDTKAA